MSFPKQPNDRLARRGFLQAGTSVLGAGLLGLLAPDELFAWGKTESRTQSVRDVNRRVRMQFAFGGDDGSHVRPIVGERRKFLGILKR